MERISPPGFPEMGGIAGLSPVTTHPPAQPSPSVTPWSLRTPLNSRCVRRSVLARSAQRTDARPLRPHVKARALCREGAGYPIGSLAKKHLIGSPCAQPKGVRAEESGFSPIRVRIPPGLNQTSGPGDNAHRKGSHAHLKTACSATQSCRTSTKLLIRVYLKHCGPGRDLELFA